MRNIKRNRILVLLAALVCLVMVFAGCGGEQQTTEPTSTDAEYKITVIDPVGNPYTTGVIVRILKDGEQAAMQVVDENGQVAKTLEKGDYTVELVFTGDESGYSYEKSGLTLSADKTELTITLTQTLSGEGVSLYVSGKECTAYNVPVGCFKVNLTAGERNYFLFTPTTEGTYEITVQGADAIGYYGSPYFVQELNIGEVVDNTLTVSITPNMIGTSNTGTAVLVIGIDAGSAEECVLSVIRVGEHQWTVEDEPWQTYMATVELAPYTVPAGAEIHEFDITASTDTYNLVYNEEDCFYHLDSADGPLVLVRLATNSKYLDSFKTILDHTAIRRYFYDENGNFLRKEEYSECVLEYLQYVDEENGVYPLTEDLKYIIWQEGEDSGWWDLDGALYLFQDAAGNNRTDINPEIAWLFMCCYITE